MELLPKKLIQIWTFSGGNVVIHARGDGEAADKKGRLKADFSGDAYAGYTLESLPGTDTRDKRWIEAHRAEVARQQVSITKSQKQMADNYRSLHPTAHVPSATRLSADTRAREAGVDVESPAYVNGTQWVRYAQEQGIPDSDILNELPSYERASYKREVRARVGTPAVSRVTHALSSPEVLHHLGLPLPR